MMSNLEILEMEKMLNEVDEEVDTYAGWKRRGYQVKKGSKALFQTKIWKPFYKAYTTEDGEEEEKMRMFKVKASFFGKSQVEAIV